MNKNQNDALLSVVRYKVGKVRIIPIANEISECNATFV